MRFINQLIRFSTRSLGLLLGPWLLLGACSSSNSQTQNPQAMNGSGASANNTAGNGGNGGNGGAGAAGNHEPADKDASSGIDAALDTTDSGAADGGDQTPDSGIASGTPSKLAFRVALDLNTYKKSYGTDAETFKKFHSDFIYTIAINGDLTDEDYQTAYEVLSPTEWAVNEDNPDKSDSYKRIIKALGKIDESLCYNETGATPGGTLLTNTQIDNNAASHGGKVAVLCRDYSTRWKEWRQETDRCLANAKVMAVIMETANPYSDQDAASLVKAVLAKGKRQYFLLPGYDTAYTLRSINYLINEAPAAMQDPRVHIVIYNYSHPDKWFGKWDTQQGTLNTIYDMAHGPGSAAFYAEDSFGGKNITLGSGEYTKDQLASIGLGDNTTLSIQVFTGTKVTIYQNDGFGGFKTTLIDSVDKLSALTDGRTAGNWAKDISSLKIERL